MRYTDTCPEAEQVQIELLRKMTPSERGQLMVSLTVQAMELSKRAIKRVNPGLSELELKVKYVEIHYGQSLAEGVRQALLRQEREDG